MNNPFITLVPGTHIAKLFVPYDHLWNTEDCALATAAFADKLTAIGYDVQAYEPKTIFDLTPDSSPDWRVFEIEIEEFSREYMERLLVNTHKLTIGHPGHGRIPFAKRQLEEIIR